MQPLFLLSSTLQQRRLLNSTARLLCNKDSALKALFSLIFLLAISSNIFAQSVTKTYTANLSDNSVDPATAPSSASFTLLVPAGVTLMTVKAWGGGGAGGGAKNPITASVFFAGGGGAGGSFTQSTVTVTPNSNIPIVAGGGGTGNFAVNINPNLTNGTGDGTDGLPSSFGGSLVTAAGGKGAKGASSTTPFTAGATGTPGITFNGGAGAAGSAAGGGGGGGAAGSTGNGGNASASTGGTAGPGGGGAGRNTPAVDFSGSTGNIPGGGGSGAYVSSIVAADRRGGFGGAGQVVVAFTCPVYSLTSTASVPSICAANGTAVITLTSTAAGLPVGNYTVIYSRSLPSATGLTASMAVTTAGTGQFTATGLTTAGSPVITINNITSGADCNTAVAAANTVTIQVKSSLTVTAGNNAQSIVKGHPTSVISFSSDIAGSSFAWTNNNTATGLAASGSGSSIASFVTSGIGTSTGTVTASNSGCSGTTNFSIAVALTVTPIGVTNFDAIWANKYGSITWKGTGAESPGTSYTIERSIDGRNFTSIGKVMANSATAIIDYKFIDKEVEAASFDNKVIYYRLKMADIDGTIKYSPIRTLKRSVDSPIIMSPNPVKDMLYINGLPHGAKMAIVYNGVGQEIVRKTIVFNPTVIDFSKYAAGVYTVKVLSTDGDVLETSKIIK